MLHGVSGSTFTVTRAAEAWNGTTLASAHSIGATVACVVTQLSLAQLADSQTADVITDETTSSTSYGDLGTLGPAITIAPGITQNHFIIFSGDIYSSTSNSRGAMAVAVNGASATDTDGIIITSPGGNNITSSKCITAAAQASGNTHTSKYRALENTMHGRTRRISGWTG